MRANEDWKILRLFLQVKVKVITSPNLFCLIREEILKSLISFGHFNSELHRNAFDFGVKIRSSSSYVSSLKQLLRLPNFSI